MALRKPSQRTIDLYNQLVAQQNKVRKIMRKIHKQAEETLGAGRLPALIVPRTARKIRSNYFEGLSKYELSRRLKAFWNAYNEKKNLFAGKSPVNKYLKNTLVDGYAQLWRDQIGEDPLSSTGKYTEDQIAQSDNKKAMIAYNGLFARGRELFFLALLNSGSIIQFKWIYQDFLSGLGERENSWIEQQIINTSLFVDKRGHLAPKKVKELYKQAGISDGIVKEYKSTLYDNVAYSYSGKHTKQTEREARRLAEEDEE